MRKLFLSCCISLSFSLLQASSQYYCTGSNSLYFKSLVNLIGSIHKNCYADLQEIAVFDLGMTTQEIDFLKSLSKVQVYSFQEKNPDLLKSFFVPGSKKDYLGWYAWKPVAIKEALEKFPYVLWIDAGCTVLKPLDALFSYIEREGYFLCTSGDDKKQDNPEFFAHPVGWGATSFVRQIFHLNDPHRKPILEKETVMAGLVGVSREGRHFFLQDWYELTKDIRHFADDGSTPNGWGTCRHDQTLLSILAYTKNLKIHLKDFSQVFPIDLGWGNIRIPFYLTWNRNFVSEKTCIHIQSGLYQWEDNIKALHYLQKPRESS